MNKTQIGQLHKHVMQGSYKLSCDYVINNQFNPIKGGPALQLLFRCTHSLSKEYSIKHLVQFVQYLQVEDIQGDDLSNYIRSIYYLVKFLIEVEEWKYILCLKPQLLPGFIKEKLVNKEQLRMYSTCRAIITKGVIKMAEQSKKDQKVIIALIQMTIDMECVLNQKELLKFLYKLTTYLPKKPFSHELGRMAVEVLIETGAVDLVTKSNFSLLMLTLQNCFVHCAGALAETAIKKLQLHMETTILHGVFDYFLGAINLFKNLEQLTFNDANTMMCQTHLLQICENVQLKYYLEEVVYFCYLKTNAIRDNMKKTQTPDVGFTANIHKNIEAFMSHAKSQAIILKHKSLTQQPKSYCAGCGIKTDLHSAIEVQIKAMDFVNLYVVQVKDPSQITDEFYMRVYQLSTKCFSLLQLLQEADCNGVKNLWELLGYQMYKMAQRLFKENRGSVNIKFLESMVKSLFVYGGKENVFIDDNYSKSLLYYYVHCLVAFKRWNDAMDMCALSVVVYPEPEHREPIVRVWNTILYNTKTADARTLWDVIIAKSSFLLSICGGKYKSLIKFDKRDVYMFELKNYVKHYPTPVHIEKCLREIRHIEEYINVIITIPMGTLTCLSTSEKFTTDCPNLKSELHLGIYKYFLYQTKYFSAMNAFKAEPKSVPIKKTVAPRDLPDVIDDQPGRAQNYEHIRTDRQHVFIKCLKESLGHLRQADKSSITETVVDIVVSMTHDFDLHCYEREARRAGYVALHFAQHLQNDLKVIQMGTYLLKYQLDTQVPEVIVMCNKRLANPKIQIDIYTKCAYYSRLATYYLKTDQLVDFRETYRLATGNFNEFGGLQRVGDKDFVFKRDMACGYYVLMIAAMNMLPCDVQGETHGSETFDLDQRVWYMLNAYRNNKEHVQYGEYLCLYFTLAEHLVWKYRWCRMFSDAEKYARHVILTAENALLTYRVCRMLIAIGKIDAARSNVDECQVKIAGLHEILHLETPDEVDSLATLLEVKVLIRSSSPVTLNKFQMPKFATHDEKCECMACVTWEYQNVLIETYGLQAQVAECYKDYKMAAVYFNGIDGLFDLLIAKRFHREDTKLEHLWSSIQFKRRIDDTALIEEQIASLLVQLNQRNYRNYYLYDEVLNVQIVMHLERMNEAKKPVICTTPEVRFDRSKSPTFNTPKLQPDAFDIAATSGTHNERSRSRHANQLVVPEVQGRRTRLRAKNLYVDLDNSEAIDAQTVKTKKNSKTAGTKTGAVKKTVGRTTRKGMR